MPRYRGSTSVTRWPSRPSASGSAPATSASPPVLAYGCASDATIRIDSAPGRVLGFGRTVFGGVASAARRPEVSLALALAIAASARFRHRDRKSRLLAVEGAFLVERAGDSVRDEVLACRTFLVLRHASRDHPIRRAMRSTSAISIFHCRTETTHGLRRRYEEAKKRRRNEDKQTGWRPVRQPDRDGRPPPRASRAREFETWQLRTFGSSRFAVGSCQRDSESCSTLEFSATILLNEAVDRAARGVGRHLGDSCGDLVRSHAVRSRRAAGVELGSAATRRLARSARTSSSSRSTRRGPIGLAPTERRMSRRRPSIGSPREGVLFEQAVSVAPLTLPAHSSIFTGKFPPEHGVRDNGGFFLGPDQVTLAEVLKAARLSHRRVRRRLRARLEVGHQPGLRHVLRRLRSQQSARASRCGASSARPTKCSTKRCRGSRSPRARRSLPGSISTIRTRRTGRPSRSRRVTRGIPITARLRSPTVRSARLVSQLQSRGLYDRTVIVVMGDHGESLGDHGESAHGFFVYNSVTHVPFVIRAPFSRHAASTRRRSGAIGRRHADRARPARRRRRRRESPASAWSPLMTGAKRGARSRRVFRSDVSAAPLRLERPSRAARRDATR